MSGTSVQDRCRGVLLGLAAGDRNGGPIRMAVRLAESLLGCGGFDPADILERYRPLVRFLGVAFALMSMVLLCIDLAAGMPWWWSASEGPGGVVFGALLFVLARPADSKGGTA